MLLVTALLVMAACSEAFPPAFYESPSFRYPIAVNDQALYYVEQNEYFARHLAELGLDGTPHGLVSPLEFIDDIEVQGSTIEWVAGHQLLRSDSTGIEMVMLPAESGYNDILLGPTGTFITSTSADNEIGQTIWYWGPDGLKQLPIERVQQRVVAADSTYLYIVRNLRGPLVRLPIAGGPEELLASDALDAKLSGDKLIYGSSEQLVERSLDDGAERVLATRRSTDRDLVPIVVAGDVVFWGNLRVMDGQVEEFLLPSSTGYIRAVAANSTDVYWVSTMKQGLLLLGEPSDYQLHRAAIRGDRPF